MENTIGCNITSLARTRCRGVNANRPKRGEIAEVVAPFCSRNGKLFPATIMVRLIPAGTSKAGGLKKVELTHFLTHYLVIVD
jgi:hypothetical protein